MNNSVEYVSEKSLAIDIVRKTLKEAFVEIVEEKYINKGFGYKYVCKSKRTFGIVIYFKADMSSKIVFENAPVEIKLLFDKKQEEKPVEQEIVSQQNIPVHLSIKISNQIDVEKIKTLLQDRFIDSEESKPNKSITYKLKIKKNNSNFTVTQYNNGTLLLQGITSSLFDEIKEIVNSVCPLTDVQNALMYIPAKEQGIVQAAIEEVPEAFSDLYKQAQSLLSEEAFNYLYYNDRQDIASAIGILNVVKEANLKIPLYNPIIYPFAKAFEGFIIKLLIDKCFFTFDQYKANPDMVKIGKILREKQFLKYIKDPIRNSGILDKLAFVWKNYRCRELHSDPALENDIVNLNDVNQAENRIRDISAAIMDGYRVLVKNGLTNEDMNNHAIADNETMVSQ